MLWPQTLSAEPAHHFFNASFWHKISTNYKDSDVDTNVRLNLIYGQVGSVRGFDLNGVVGRVNRDMRGVQLTGLYSQVGGMMKGISVTGGVNYVAGDVKGVQVSFLANYDRGSVVGIQYGNFFNYIEDELRGAQLSTILNVNDGDGRWLQLGSIANMNGGTFKGAQLAGAFNVANDEMRGLQFGLTSFAFDMKGVQIGGLNVAGTFDGVQVGLFNWTKQNDGIPIGIINLAENGSVDWVNFGSSYAAFSTGIRTEVNNFYSMASVGWGDIKDSLNDTVFLSWHYGYAWEIGEHWRIGPDAGFVHVVPTTTDDITINDEPHYAIQFRALVEFRNREKFSVFAGAGSNTVFDQYSSSANSETDPLFFLGVSLH